jgi:hypothetical protein
VVSLGIAGQIHDQVRRLPPGTKFTGLTVDEDQTVIVNTDRRS